MRLINVDELSQKIGLAKQTVKNRLSKNPDSLPPRRIIPDCDSILFLDSDVEKWILSLPLGGALTSYTTAGKKRGRPRKTYKATA